MQRKTPKFQPKVEFYFKVENSTPGEISPVGRVFHLKGESFHHKVEILSWSKIPPCGRIFDLGVDF